MTYEQMQAKQLRLSVLLAAIFLLSMFPLPILNHFAPDLMLSNVLGLPFIWLFVGVILHLEFWVIAIVYTLNSNKWERELVDGK